MTIDTASLKAAALACDPSKSADEAQHNRRLAEFYDECEPEDILALIAANEQLAEEVELDNRIIAERDRLLNAIPECAAHGQCVPFAIQWVKDIQAEVKELLEERDQLKAENEALRKQVTVLQSDANSWQSGYDEGRRMGTKTMLDTRALDARLAGFWRSPKDIPPEGVSLVVLRDAGTVGNDGHAGHRTGRWLELTSAWGKMFACDAISTGTVIGWVGADEFKGIEALRPSRIPAGLYAELAALRDLRNQVKAYIDGYLQDEVESADSCISDDQHQSASMLANLLQDAFAACWSSMNKAPAHE